MQFILTQVWISGSVSSNSQKNQTISVCGLVEAQHNSSSQLTWQSRITMLENNLYPFHVFHYLPNASQILLTGQHYINI
jgi:hypothetical protein